MTLLRRGFLMQVAAAMRALSGRRCSGVSGTIMDTMQDILSDEPIADIVTEEVVAEPVAEAQPRQSDGKFAPKGETESASPAPVEEPPFEHAAVKGERERRQKAEQRARELEEHLQALQNPPQPLPSVFEDESAWQQQFGSQVVSTAVQQATFNSKLDMSEMMVRQANADFDEMKEAFLALAEENPVLRQQVLSDPHPWNKAYQIAKNHKAMQELGATDVESLKARIREEMQAEMAQQPAAQAPQIPQSLADSQSSRSSVGVPVPLTLHEIINGKGP